MRFCDKCGTMMRGKAGKLVCPSCGASVDAESSIKRKVEHKPDEEIVVRSANEDLAILPKVKALCPECGHKEAAYWFEQTRSADEAPTRFYRCLKCRNTWREYS